MAVIPEIRLGDGVKAMPAVGMGTADVPFAPASTKPAILHAMELGYRHFDTASLYETEQILGEAIIEALSIGLIASRSELFITTKLWCDQAHPDLVVSALRESLRNLQLDYIDLYLIHMPLSSKPGTCRLLIKRDDALPLDIKSVWKAMEDCQKLGLTNLIGVSNFSPHMIDKLLVTAEVPPSVNQICLRWVLEQGVSLVVKSFNKERLKENLQIFDWELNQEERQKIDQIPQRKNFGLKSILSTEGKLCFELSDFEIY
ncbi:NADPH-dependent codeinone reductase 1-1 isoform X2 [Dendrobium catenatum]|uniref:NADPH-dependent codeinone reductase 1-1 isoform X2 n=1 Tax=Dendrobium catenatum TaxID=906689 RepID=UPI0009F5801D|nr:NADPH-dependent codeinone reductase 1-1 isoform X2 [Dendrobium catenatum]